MPISSLIRVVAFTLVSLFLVGCQSGGKKSRADRDGGHYGKVLKTEKGIASYYSVRTNRGTRTASGRKLRDHELTAAHRRWAFGTPVRVTNLVNGNTVVVTVTDRGPHVRGRVIDVTMATAKKLDFVKRGLVPVKIEALEKLER